MRTKRISLRAPVFFSLSSKSLVDNSSNVCLSVFGVHVTCSLVSLSPEGSLTHKLFVCSLDGGWVINLESTSFQQTSNGLFWKTQQFTEKIIRGTKSHWTRRCSEDDTKKNERKHSAKCVNNMDREQHTHTINLNVCFLNIYFCTSLNRSVVVILVQFWHRQQQKKVNCKQQQSSSTPEWAAHLEDELESRAHRN